MSKFPQSITEIGISSVKPKLYPFVIFFSYYVSNVSLETTKIIFPCPLNIYIFPLQKLCTHHIYIYIYITCREWCESSLDWLKASQNISLTYSEQVKDIFVGYLYKLKCY